MRRSKMSVSVSEVYFLNHSIITVIAMNTFEPCALTAHQLRCKQRSTLWKVILSAHLHNVEKKKKNLFQGQTKISYKKKICFFSFNM